MSRLPRNSSSPVEFIETAPIAPINPPVRLGIISTARITRRWLGALPNSKTAVLHGVASRDLDRAKEWRREAEVECETYGSYDDLLADDAIDAVYIPLPNGLHAEWCERALQAGKMVFCEKSLVANPEDMKRVRTAVKETGGWLEETYQYRHHPLFAFACDTVQTGRLGPIRRGVAHFSFKLDDPANVRWDRDLGGGSIYDVGCYCVGVLRHTLGEEPSRAKAKVEWFDGPTGKVDQKVEAELEFPSGAKGLVKCGFNNPRFVSQWAVIGERASLHCLHDFAWTADEQTGLQQLSIAEFDNTGAGALTTNQVVENHTFAVQESLDVYTRMIDESCARWKAGEPPRFGVVEAEKNLRTLWAIIKSGETGGDWVDVE
jgi:predicted dehydrogenase